MPRFCTILTLVSHVFLLLGMQVSSAADPADPLPVTLTNALAVRRLSPEEAKRQIPVHLRAVVTYVDPGRTVFIQDASGGTFIRGGVLKQPPAPGQEIEFSGVTYPGLYVPGTESRSVHVLGPASLPAPHPVTFDELAAGRHNYEWVEVRGVVRQIGASTEKGTLVRLSLGTGKLDVYVLAGKVPDDLKAGARVRVDGLAAGFINDRRQLVSPHLRVSDFNAFVLEVPALEDPFAATLIPVREVLHFAPDKIPGDPVRVRGVVLHDLRGQALFIRDGDQGLYLQTAQPGLVNPGDEVEAVGFPEMGPFSAFLADAQFHRVSQGKPPAPVKATISEMLKGTYDGNLVQVKARLLEVLRGATDLTLVMQDGDTLFKARLPSPDEELDGWQPGAQLALTGVCRIEHADEVQRGFQTRPRSFELWLRTVEDVAVVNPASWWTEKRLTLVITFLLVGVLLALVWAGQLRARVQAQTAIIQDKLKSEATADERRRIAREFHDTLEQELVGLSLRLDAAMVTLPDNKSRDLVEVARRLVLRLQVEAREFVWNLREGARSGDLGAALSESAERLRTGSTDVRLKVSGAPQSLPAGVEHHLLRVMQEAVANALKHAKAKTVLVELAYAPERTTLTVKDDGAGFVVDQTQAAPGHFGLLGMQERVKKMGGIFELKSQPGVGTVVAVTVSEKVRSIRPRV